MAILSYVVFTAAGATERVAGRLAVLPGCTVVRAENRDALLLLTETDGAAEEDALRSRLTQVEGIRSMALAFGALPA